MRVERLVVERAGRRVLDQVDLDLPAGAISAIVGPSGAGKSTLLRCLCRLEEPVRGRVLLSGRDIRALDPRALRRTVGMVFQTPVMFPGSVRDNVAYGLRGAAADARLREALAAAQLDPGFLARDAARLSVGEAQRVSIARAMALGPQVLLLDEPTAALDQDAAAGVEAVVRDLVERTELTVVVVTHDLAQARRLADHCALLVTGRIAATGTAGRLAAVWRELLH